MKKIHIARLVIFFLAGIGLYFYMSNAIAAKANQSEESDRMLYMKPTQAYKIWDAIGSLEDSWYVENAPQLKLAPLSKIKENNIIRLTQDYPDLVPLVTQLIVARKRGNWDNFLLYKEKIAERLRPLWRIGAQATMKEETKKRSIYNRFKNWLATWKQSAYNTIQRVYAYFFSSSASPADTATDNKQDAFLQQVLGQKTSEPTPKKEPIFPVNP